MPETKFAARRLATLSVVVLIAFAGCSKDQPRSGGDMRVVTGDMRVVTDDMRVVTDGGSGTTPDLILTPQALLDFTGAPSDFAGTDIEPASWAILSWDAPTTDTMGNPLQPGSIAGYNVYYSTISPLTLSDSYGINVGNVTTYIVIDLSPGTWYFGVAAFTSDNTQSALSNIGTKTIQ